MWFQTAALQLRFEEASPMGSNLQFSPNILRSVILLMVIHIIHRKMDHEPLHLAWITMNGKYNQWQAGNAEKIIMQTHSIIALKNLPEEVLEATRKQRTWAMDARWM